MADLTDLTVAGAAALLASRTVSAAELLEAHVRRVDAVNGNASHDGDPRSINAWVRRYPERAEAAASRADARLAAGAVRDHGPAPALCGIPVGLKDLYAVAGLPLTASSRVGGSVPAVSCEAWQRLEAQGAVLVGHLHTHEWAAGGSTDQVGNPWALERTAGGSSGGSAAALAAHMIPLATGTDTAGSLRIPSALCGTSAMKATRGLVPLRGVLPLSASLDHAGPMARTLTDCALALAALLTPVGATGPAWPAPPVPGDTATLRGARIALSPRTAAVPLDADVAAGLDRAEAACRALGATVVAPEGPDGAAPGGAFLDVLATDMLAHHAGWATERANYRASTRDLLEHAEQRAMTAPEYVELQRQRDETTARWQEWLAEHRLDAVLEPTVPMVAPLRGNGYDAFFTEDAGRYIALTHHWNWTGFPVAALPAGVGAASGLPVGVSLVGGPGTDWRLLALGAELQGALGVAEPR